MIMSMIFLSLYLSMFFTTSPNSHTMTEKGWNYVGQSGGVTLYNRKSKTSKVSRWSLGDVWKERAGARENNQCYIQRALF